METKAVDPSKMDKRTREYKEWKANYDANPPKGNQGVGDIVATATELLGINKLFDKLGIDCNCDERQEILNRELPTRFKPRCFTEQEFNDYKDFRKVRTLTLSREQIRFVAKLYSDVFNRVYYEPCSGCSPKPLIDMIDKLDTVFETYE